MALLVSAHSFAYSQAPESVLSILNGIYMGHDCEVRVKASSLGAKIEMFKKGEYMEYLVKKDSPFQYKPYGKFVATTRLNEGNVNYTELSFLTTPVKFGHYAVIEKRVVRNLASTVSKIECIIIDQL